MSDYRVIWVAEFRIASRTYSSSLRGLRETKIVGAVDAENMAVMVLNLDEALSHAWLYIPARRHDCSIVESCSTLKRIATNCEIHLSLFYFG